eukprot:CAMPEP_0197421824 /NCGR_PEP_ID=MMETSP1170-20131217/11784_1 /TAXON_ID=54406 /ORGANISM="Sarcinochrysis sp, Strain CCMP770" /LENGTH=335 /DNA_ID=CAMNT_0042949109 /DNA_START=22 /DNA_END=1029 /DNA_ORIENTATION=+
MAAAEVRMPTKAEEVTTKEKSLAELDAALTESRVYEESKRAELTMRRLRLEHAEEAARDARAQLNAETLETLRSFVDRTPHGDLSLELGDLLKTYQTAAARIAAKAPRGGLTTADNPVCWQCKTYHGVDGWNGLCSRCYVVSTAIARTVPCAPNIFKAVGRAVRQRFMHRTLPSSEQRLSARTKLESRLRAHGKRGFDVAGDGACQFRAVSHQLFDDESHHLIVRSRVLDYLETHPPAHHDCDVYVSQPGSEKLRVEAVGDDRARYLETIAEDAAWGDHTTLQAIADVFQVRILMVTTFDTPPFEYRFEPAGADVLREIWLGFFSEMHYISAVPL